MISRPALAGLWAMLPLAVLLLVLAVIAPPDRVPVGWTGPAPDRFVTGAGFLSAVLAVTVITTLAAAGTALLSRVLPQAWSRWVLVACATAGWGAALLYLVTVWRVAQDGPERVGQGWPLLALLGGLLAGAVCHRVHGRRVPTPDELDRWVPDRARVRPVRGRAVRPVDPWGTQVSSTTLRVVGWGVVVVFGVALVLVIPVGDLVATLVLLVAGVGTAALALAWSAVEVSADEEAFTVRSLLLRAPVLRVPVEQVVGVEVTHLDPMRWGGVGLRTLPDRTALIPTTAGGPGLVLYRHDGRRFAVQVTEGEEVARAGARTLLRAAGQRRGAVPSS